MLRKSLALILLVLVVIGANAQDEACSIFAVLPFGDGGYELAVYAPDGDGGYHNVATVASASVAQVVVSHLSNEHVHAAVVLREDVPGTTVDLYTLHVGGILIEGQAALDDVQPAVGGWSYGGRYLALYEPETSPGVAVLHVYDTYTGEMHFHGAVLKEYGVLWSPGQDTIAYSMADGLYAAAPDGLTVWSHGTGMIGLKPLRWLSDTELSVSRCIESCVATITDVYSGDVRTVEFGAYIPEAYLAWRDSYIVARVEDGAIGVWDEVNGFRSYTGDSIVLSRPTVTRDGRHLSVHLKPTIRPALLVGDLLDSKLWYTQPLNEPTDTFRDALFGDWNVREQKFLYTDAGLAWVYDTVANETRAVIEQVARAQWVCPSRG